MLFLELDNLAAYFEKKYGNFGNTAKFDKKKRRRHERIEDFMDMGEGYDAEDDFIDDADARDLFVPQEYDTWHGGFYVNQGRLRFKMSDETDEEVSLMTGTKKRNLGLKSISDDETADRNTLINYPFQDVSYAQDGALEFKWNLIMKSVIQIKTLHAVCIIDLKVLKI